MDKDANTTNDLVDNEMSQPASTEDATTDTQKGEQEEKTPDTVSEVAEEADDDAKSSRSFGKVLDEDTDRDTNTQWYVVHTYSGYEDQVADALRHRIETLNMKDKIFEVIVPKEKQIEIRSGKRRTVEKKIFPGYILVNMIMTKNSWYVVRNTPSVTGFIGTGTEPAPINEDEVEIILKRMGVEDPQYKIDLEKGDPVRINDGPFKNMEAIVKEIDQEKGKVKALVNIFGRETPVELDFLQVKKI